MLEESSDNTMTDRREGNLAKRNLLIAVQARRRPFPCSCLRWKSQAGI